MGSFSKCSTGYWPALGEGYVSTIFPRGFVYQWGYFGALFILTLQWCFEPSQCHHNESGCPWGQKTLWGNVGLCGAESGHPLAMVFHTHPSNLSLRLPSQAMRGLDHANPNPPPVITGPATNSQQTSKWKDGTHLFLMCCGEPRHRKLPRTMMASLVHTASHSSMLWETRPGVSRSPRLRARIHSGMGEQRHAIIENQLTFHTGTSQNSNSTLEMDKTSFTWPTIKLTKILVVFLYTRKTVTEYIGENLLATAQKCKIDQKDLHKHVEILRKERIFADGRWNFESVGRYKYNLI